MSSTLRSAGLHSEAAQIRRNRLSARVALKLPERTKSSEALCEMVNVFSKRGEGNDQR